MKSSRISGSPSPRLDSPNVQPDVRHGSQSPDTGTSAGLPEASARGSKRPRSPESGILEPEGRKGAGAAPKSASRLTDGLQRPQQPSLHGSPDPRSQASSGGTPPVMSSPDSSSRGLSSGDALSEEVNAVKRVVEYHNHLNGVLSPESFLYVLFGAGEQNQEIPWDSRLETAYWNATKALTLSTHEKLKQLGFVTTPKDDAPTAPETEMVTAAPAQRDIMAMSELIKHTSEAISQQIETRTEISSFHRQDLTDRRKLLTMLGGAFFHLPKERTALLSRCLAAHLASGTLPFVHFDWAYTVRSALWKAAFKESNGAARSDKTATLTSFFNEIKTQPIVRTSLGSRLASDLDMNPFFTNFLERPASLKNLTLIVDSDVGEPLDNTEPTQKPLAIRLRELQGVDEFSKINIQFTAASRKIFFFDEVFRVLRGGDNKLDEVQLQGKVSPSEVSPALVKHLAASHCLRVGFLSTIPHDMLSHSSQADLAAQEGHAVANKAFSMVHAPNPVGLPFVGIDVAGPEIDEFSPAALAALVTEAVDRTKAVNPSSKDPNSLQADSTERGPTVLRIHAGEAYAVDEQDHQGKEQRKKVGRTNCSLILRALSENEGAKELMATRPEQLQVRIGHATFINTQELRKVAELGIILEFNPHSNAATGVDPEMEMKSFLRVLMFNSLEKVYRPNSPARVRFCLSTDGQGVMDTTFVANLKTAAKQVNDRLLEPFRRRTLSSSSTAYSPVTKERFDAMIKSDDKKLEDQVIALNTLLESYTEEELMHAHRHSVAPPSLSLASPGPNEVTSAQITGT
jgi:hypothetical protein